MLFTRASKAVSSAAGRFTNKNLCKPAKRKRGKKNRKTLVSLRSVGGADSDDEMPSTQSSTRSSRTTRSTRDDTMTEEVTVNGVNGTNGHHDEESQRDSEPMDDDSPVEISGERLSTFKGSLYRAFRENRSQSLSIPRIRQLVNTDNATPYTQGEMTAAFNRMTDDNQVMVADGNVFLI
nr:unnamed protein product [Callosobruchus chinensis]